VSDKLTEALHRLPAVDWLSTEEIRRRARRRTTVSVVSAVLAIALVATTGVMLVSWLAGSTGGPVAPGTRAPSTPGRARAPEPPDPSPQPAVDPIVAAAMLGNADLPVGFTTDETRMMDHLTGPGYLAQFADWPLMRFEACPTFPAVSAHRLQETRTVRSFWRDNTDYSQRWIANGHWVERHASETNAERAVADVRAVVEQCAAYARLTVEATGFAGDESLRFVERGGGRDANDDMYWTVVRVGRYVSVLRLASDADLADRMAQRICQAYPTEC
jgi:hypothetical protein